MSTHKIEIASHTDGELYLQLVCTATKGAPCKRRPAENDRETWSASDEDLVDTDDCWAVDWVEAVGFVDAVRGDGPGVLVSLPVTVAYDEGVVVSPAADHPTIEGLEPHESTTGADR